MRILTAVTNDIKKYKKKYIQVLDEMSGGAGEIIADVADEFTKIARELIHATDRYDVTVYGTRDHRNEDMYDEDCETFERIRKTPGEWVCEKKAALAEAADIGLFVWHGWDIDIYTDILSLLMQGKSSMVIKNGESYIVNEVEDIRKLALILHEEEYTPMDGFIKKSDYEEVIDTFVPSKQMADFLKKNPVPKTKVIDIIVNSPVKLEKKANFCKALEEADDERRELADAVEKLIKTDRTGDYRTAYQLYLKIRENTFTYHYEETEKALKELNEIGSDDILFVRTAEFSEYKGVDRGYVKKDDIVPAKSRQEVSGHMFMDDYYVERWAFKDDEYWCETQKWGKGDGWRMEKSYRYIFRYENLKETDDFVPEGEAKTPSSVIFFDKCIYKSNFVVEDEATEEIDPVVYFEGKCMPPLPVPFKPGDILILDCVPFMSDKKVILLEVNNEDGCGAQIMYRDEFGLWQRGILDRDFGYGCYRPRLSCFFRLEKYDEPMSLDEIPEYEAEKRGLKMVSDYIYQNENAGEWLIVEFLENRTGGVSDEELIELIGGRQ